MVACGKVLRRDCAAAGYREKTASPTGGTGGRRRCCNIDRWKVIWVAKAKKEKKEKKEKASKKRKKGAQDGTAEQAAVQKAPKVGGGFLVAVLRLLIVLLSLVEICLVLFIGLRYVQANILGGAAQADSAVTPPAVQTQVEGKASYIGPGLYIKDGVVIYDYAGITGTAIPGAQG